MTNDIDYVDIGGVRFLKIWQHMLPLHRIKSIDLNAPNGGCTNSVRIVTDDNNEDYVWAYSSADAVRQFLGVNN